MRHVRRVAFLMALAAPAAVATAQERALSGGAGYGGPLGAAVMGELLYGLRVDVHEDEEQVKGPLRPENACFGLTSLRRRLARPIPVDSNRQRFVPFSVSQVGNLQISRRVPGLNNLFVVNH